MSSTKRELGQTEDPDSAAVEATKRRNIESMDPEEGLSVQHDIRRDEEITGSSSMLNGVELEVIESSSSESSGNESESEAMAEKPKNAPNNEDDDYESSEDYANVSSDLEEFQFNEPDDQQQETNLKLFGDDKVIPPLQDIIITKNACTQVRAFLKTQGHGELLDVFLPSSPTPEDILTLSKLLGFSPSIKKKRWDTLPQEALMHFAISILKTAINKVLEMRTRLVDFHTVDDVTNALMKAENILVLTGAGISTSLGIPDFRSSKGFYSKMKHLGLDDPQDVFSLEIFKRDPSIFYNIAHMILPPEHSFTPLHGFIKLLQDKGKLLRNYTQNIDNLEGNVGILPEKLVQCHGSFATASCVTCKYKIPGETLYPNLNNKKIAYCPFCESERKNLLRKYEKMEDQGVNVGTRFWDIESFGVMKPDITFFGENLPDRYHSTIKEDVKKCDLLITIGTSLKVAPVSEIVNRVSPDIPQILINRDPINHCEFDVEFLGYCDQVITWLCGRQLGWGIQHKDFEKILNSGLEMKIIDEQHGRYKITDANERLQISLKKLKEIKEREAEGNFDKTAQKGESLADLGSGTEFASDASETSPPTALGKEESLDVETPTAS